MFCPRLAAGTGDPGNAFKKQWIYHLCIHPSDVDEFFAAYDRMAVFAGKDGGDQYDTAVDWAAKAEFDQYRRGDHSRYDLQFSAIYGIANLQFPHQDTFDAAKDLGANWIQSLWRITLPQILPGIVSGITMVFVPAMTTFVISNLLGGAKINLIGNVIEQEFTTANNWYGGAGLSIVLMILILGSMAVMSHFDKEGEGAAIW